MGELLILTSANISSKADSSDNLTVEMPQKTIIQKIIESIETKPSKLVELCKTNRDLTVKVYMKCKYEPWFFIDEFCWTNDPQLASTIEALAEAMGEDIDVSDIPSIIRFRLFEFQRDTIKKLVNIRQNSISFNNSLIEKCRQMGLSWLLTALELWAISFWDGVSILNLSRKEDEVDDGGDKATFKSLHGKIKFMHERLPAFLKANLVFKFLTVRHDERDSFIRGESANPNAGRGGTFKFILVDEAAHVPKSESVFESIKQACKRGICLNSTPNGKGNVFARIRFSKKTTFQVTTLHWHLHPHRDNVWYELQKRDMTDEQVAQELDISYERSVKGRVYPEFDYNTHVVDGISYNSQLPVYISWDFGLRDATSILAYQIDVFDNVYLFWELENSGKTIDWYARKLKEQPFYHSIRQHYGDPAGKQKNMITGYSVIQELAVQHGISIVTRTTSIVDKIRAVKKFLQSGRNGRPGPKFYISNKCTNFIDCIINYKYPEEKDGKELCEIPLHDWTSHCMNSFEYFVINKFPTLLKVIRTNSYRDNRMASRR